MTDEHLQELVDEGRSQAFEHLAWINESEGPEEMTTRMVVLQIMAQQILGSIVFNSVALYGAELQSALGKVFKGVTKEYHFTKEQVRLGNFTLGEETDERSNHN